MVVYGSGEKQDSEEDKGHHKNYVAAMVGKKGRSDIN